MSNYPDDEDLNAIHDPASLATRKADGERRALQFAGILKEKGLRP